MSDDAEARELPDFEPSTGHEHGCSGRDCSCAGRLYAIAQDAEIALADREASPSLPAQAAREIDRLGAYEDALRNIAAAAVSARRTRRLDELLVTVESQLSALIAVGYVPGPPDSDRRPLTVPVRP